MKSYRRLLAWLIQAACLVGGSTPVQAQTIPYVAPTPAECTAAVQALGSGNRDVRTWWQLSGCGVAGGNALASALRDGTAETDTVYLTALYNTSASIRDSAVFAAGLAVAGTATATPAARVIAFLIGLAQVEPALGLRMNVGLTSLWTTGVGSSCPLTGRQSTIYNSTTSLAGNANVQLAAKADEVKTSSAPLAVKEFAQCIRERLEYVVPITVSPSLITLSYICGNRFRVQNSSSEWLSVTWSMEKWPDTGGFSVAPNSAFTFTTRSVGSVRLYQHGVFLFATQNGGNLC